MNRTNKQGGAQMQNDDNAVIQAGNLQKTFYSIRGFWKREKHPVEAVQGICFADLLIHV
jgi:hypothetical protein